VNLTPAQTIGPFFRFALPLDDGPFLVSPDAPGAVRVAGRVLDGAGQPVSDALVEIWQAAPGTGTAGDDRTDDPSPGSGFRGFGRCPTDAAGRYRFVTAKPSAVPPDAPHLTVLVFARGLLNHLVTRLYFPDEDAANAVDPVLSALPDPARRDTLIARRDGPEGTEGTGGTSLAFDIRLQGDHETVFFGA
jgi:protocatechuate 3,4-dioxygenase alpha subunit